MPDPIRISFARSLVTSGYTQQSAPEARFNWDLPDATAPYLLMTPLPADEKVEAPDVDEFIF